MSAAYPTNERIANISKRTTKKERITIDGVDETTTRMNTLGLSAGHVNALQFGHEMLGMPKLDEMLDAYRQVNNLESPVLHQPELVLEMSH